jgi:hypothetical protein
VRYQNKTTEAGVSPSFSTSLISTRSHAEGKQLGNGYLTFCELRSSQRHGPFLQEIAKHFTTKIIPLLRFEAEAEAIYV